MVGNHQVKRGSVRAGAKAYAKGTSQTNGGRLGWFAYASYSAGVFILAQDSWHKVFPGETRKVKPKSNKGMNLSA